jgi:hypothetical protein
MPKQRLEYLETTVALLRGGSEGSLTQDAAVRLAA